MPEFTIHSVKCPNCQRPFQNFHEFLRKIECPYCHEIVFIERPDMNDNLPQMIIPFNTTEDDFSRKFVNTLANRYLTPSDIFDSISHGEIFRAYIPMYLYEGKCRSYYRYRERKLGYYSTMNYDSSSVSKEYDWFQVMYPAWEPKEDVISNFNQPIPTKLKKELGGFLFHSETAQQYNSDLIDPTIPIYPKHSTAHIIWFKCSKSMMDKAVKYVIHEKYPSLNLIGYEIERSDYQMSSDGLFVLVSVWFVNYSYKGRDYFFMMDGQGGNINYSCPEDTEAIEYIEKNVSGADKISDVLASKLFWVIAIVLVFTYGIGLIIIALMYILKAILGKKAQDRSTEVESERKRRAEVYLK